MNKLEFSGDIQDLYAEDYQYLQNEIERDINNITGSVLDNNNVASIIDGFEVIIDPSDTKKVNVTHSSVIGRIITSSGLVFTTSTGFTNS